MSTLYRLMTLSYDRTADSLSEVVRAALLSFSSTLFLQRQFRGSAFEHLASYFRQMYLQTVYEVRNATPASVSLWMGFVLHLVDGSMPQCITEHLKVMIRELGLLTWQQTLQVLKTVMWVDFAHDDSGRRLFDQLTSES